ncbi:MAG TPA: thiamine phosphate synthase [Candidatus Sulfotelmatobacter sp.]|nr:thiamine phosphate synthase [Candidatus Sulfotelmatobacter sp.]
MPESCLLYYITDRTAFPGDERARRFRLLGKITEAAGAGVNYIQLREKDLSIRELESLAREAVQIILQLRTKNRELRTDLLINSRTDVALATGAAGVHLPANDVSAEEVRKIWKCGTGTLAREILPENPRISISCHSPEEVTQAAAIGANLALFAPVFEKKDAPGTSPKGLDALRQACHAKISVLALGGITLQNAHSCLQAGAAGIAAIRLFQENDIAAIVRTLRGVDGG